MTFRTPHRRISPRTRRKCRAIKDFFRRALGTSSQPDIKTNSSIELSVSDLKSKIIGIEQQLDKVSKHCRDLTCLEHSFKADSEKSLIQLQYDNESTGNTKKSDENINNIATKLLYRTSNSQYRNSDESNDAVNVNGCDDKNDMISKNHCTAQNIRHFQSKHKNNENGHRGNADYDLCENHRRTKPKYKTMRPIYSTSSFHSMIDSGRKFYSKPAYSHNEKRHSKKEYIEPLILKKDTDNENITRDLKIHGKLYDDRHNKIKRAKRVCSEVDKDFLANIIKRQYKPVKLFGRKDSDFSQFSAPVCRDHEFTIRDEIQEDSELCSCCFDGHRKKRHHYIRNADLSDMRSVCDTRLYTSKGSRRYKVTNSYKDDYNNSALYDTVPVKEKSSPKSRRKFTEDNMIAYQYCKEVPPSPKSHRPRLNLKVQRHADYEDSLIHERDKRRRNSPEREVRKKVASMTESGVSLDSNLQKTRPKIKNNSKSQKLTQIQEDIGTMSSLQYSNFINEQTNLTNNDTTLNAQITDSMGDKTDKTLSEIKDILQTFLQEIKRESAHNEKLDVVNKIENKQPLQNQESVNANSNIMPNNGHSFNNYSVGQYSVPSFLPPFPNPCCYPILPVCPVNCIQNGYIIPNPSYTCTICDKNSKEPGSHNKESCCNKNITPEEMNTNNETKELIKEIYKFVSQQKTPRTREKDGGKSNNEHRIFDKKLLTSRSVGGSTKASLRRDKHDANVGTLNMKSYSKSCEAIGSRVVTDTYNTNASYSDTILEKLSLETTQSSSETDLSSEVAEDEVKKSTFKRVLNSLKLFKKKKKDIIEEPSESEDTAEVEVKSKPPFKQHITSYAMHGQEYFHPPPIPKQHCCRSPPSDLCGHGYEPRNCCPPSHQFCSQYNHGHATYPQNNRTQYPTALPYPNYDGQFNQIPPQVPLCLKEVEVKSIGTQSDRKVSILRKFTKKNQQSQQAKGYTAVKDKPNFWKTLQEKAQQNSNDPMDFSLKTQKQLAQGDMNLKNAMLKKMFYKRNPFSPRNLIVRTLLGKDKSSFGEPPKMYRPRMFL